MVAQGQRLNGHYDAIDFGGELDKAQPLHFEGLDDEEESVVGGIIYAGVDQGGSGDVEEGTPGVGRSAPLEGERGYEEQEGALGPRQSSRGNRGVPPLRFIEILEAAAEAADGGAPAN